MRSKWVSKREFEHLLAGLMPENALALRVSEAYGVRIGDVLQMRHDDARSGYWSFKEQKTGKRRIVRLGGQLQRELLRISGRVFVFEHRTDWRKHRTRQAVYKDLTRIAKAYRLQGVTPHSARKIYSVEQYRASGGNLKKVQRLLNHSDEAVTILYALADELSAVRKKRLTNRKFDVTMNIP